MSEHGSANDVTCWDCKQHPTERLEQMFLDLIQAERIRRGQNPALRTVFLKQHGVAWGFFEPVADLPPALKIGTFAHGTLPAWVRFSSDTQPTSPDLHTTMGVGIKLFGVPGGTLMGPEDTADFILQNHDVFFVDNATDFCEFTTAGVIDGNYPRYLADHPKTARILKEMEKAEASCLTAKYWAILPFAFGEQFVKYRLTPVDAPAGEPAQDENYLAIDLARRLRGRQARFAFQLQFRTDPTADPLDKATVRWRGEWQTVAHLILPQQDIDARGQSAYGEHLAFNIWRTPQAQAPQGSIAATRRSVYQGSADQRRLANGIPRCEPGDPRTAQQTPANEDCIVSAAIYPPIGICRVGGSKEYYLGPEVPEPLPLAPGAYRDGEGKLKREAARFRIYGLNALGQAVKELTAADAQIVWHARVANQKASWYQFQLALDIPEAADAPPTSLRNSSVSDRAALAITPAPKSISGTSQSGCQYAFDDGEFLGKCVYLGELRTDESGRLIVLGGHGKSASADGTPAVTFANNERWHDDVSDGPIEASVTYQGVALQVEPAWVVCAPPNYGPQQKSVRTMWDLMRDTACTAGTLAKPARPSFQQDIRPLFERMSNLQWVNQGFAGGFGFKSPFEFSTEDWLARLNDPTPANTELRRILSNNFRRFDDDSYSPVPWPWLYGDAMAIPPADTPRQNAALSDLQLEMLEQWVVGDFDADYDPAYAPPRRLEDVAIADQPDTLTRAAMEFCLADAFHPGCEMTWPMRQAGMYSAPFRLKHRKDSNPEPTSFGAQLGDAWTLPDGPISGGQSPGSITRWMAVPWQTDTASCRSGYSTDYDPYLPTFWPARVPNEVMGQAAYEVVMDETLPLEQRRQAFANRADWLAPLNLSKSYTHQINHMIHHFEQMGVVEVRPGPQHDPHFPPVLQVSDQRQKPWEAPNVGAGAAAPQDPAEAQGQHAQIAAGITAQPPEDSRETATDLSTIEKVRRFPQRRP